MEPRDELTIMGLNLGTFDGWDEIDNLAVQFYSFEPNEDWQDFIPPCEILSFNFNTGVATVTISEDEIRTAHILDLLAFKSKLIFEEVE